jgi:hypothetical protein
VTPGRSYSYPVDPNDPNTGQPGIMVFLDPSVPAQAPTTRTRATLAPIGGGGPSGTLQMTLQNRAIYSDPRIQGIGGTTALFTITTTVGIEVVSCAVNPAGTTECGDNLVGDPLIGGSVILGVDGVPAAQGTIAAIPIPSARAGADSLNARSLRRSSGTAPRSAALPARTPVFP